MGPFRLVVGATLTAEQINLIEGALRSATRRSGRQLKSWNGKGSLRVRCKTGVACTYAMHFDRVKSSSAPSWRVSFIASQHSCAPHEIDIHPELEANLRFFVSSLAHLMNRPHADAHRRTAAHVVRDGRLAAGGRGCAGMLILPLLLRSVADPLRSPTHLAQPIAGSSSAIALADSDDDSDDDSDGLSDEEPGTTSRMVAKVSSLQQPFLSSR